MNSYRADKKRAGTTSAAAAGHLYYRWLPSLLSLLSITSAAAVGHLHYRWLPALLLPLLPCTIADAATATT
jgi:hypothetical protein